ncbi:DUF305 domain-containing protein [Robertkochia solimangrovi]|uniref:DUF305 domain-containing protein n=1 Tax=Robertkochia solimangrovi TaxID=2213046 RepID=UPI00117DA1FE|nr:DUF305 domain-containing protein [Robertkochia solimangrovi]TRZ44472.1 DUF305 domain-containing protein [Robertkochia solimangrovi]
MDHKNKSQGSYRTFFMMLAVSFVAMYGTMYLNIYKIDHVYFSLTRFYMACMGIATMAVVMFLFMRNMYRDRNKNMFLIAGSVVLFFGSLYLVRAQKPIGDLLWLKAMIPHHSIAILTSNRADIQDPEVKKLAGEIIEAQEREIAEMKQMIRRLEGDSE